MAANDGDQRRYWILHTLLLFILKTGASDKIDYPLCLPECHCNITQHHIDCRGAGFTSVPQNIHSETVSLDLSENPLSELSKFPELKQLKTLNITNFALSKLNSGSLSPLTSLEYLNLGINLLENIPKDLEIPFLKVLILSGNIRLDFGNATGPILNSPTLQELDMSDCLLTQLPEGAFSSLPSLKHLNLHNNLLTTLPPNIFQTLNVLSSLDLSHNAIESLPNNSFQHNPVLTKLNVSFNSLDWHSPKDHFFMHGLSFSDDQEQETNSENNAILISSSIEILDLTRCGLRNLYNKSLSSLPNLRHLYVLNSLLHMDPEAFQHLINLETLHINWIEDVEVSGDIFELNYNLRSLRCPSCFSLHSPLSSKSISYLDLSFLHSSDEQDLISKVIFGHTGLHMSRSRELQIIHYGHFANLPALSTLRIRSRNILIISERAFEKNNRLRVVDFSNCRLRAISNLIFAFNPDITEITLADNIITAGDGPIFTPNKAQSLDLSDNVLTKISRNYFSGLTSLVSLNLSKNPLFGWEEGAFSELHNLEVLDLSQTHLLHLHPDSFVINEILKSPSTPQKHSQPSASSSGISETSFHLLHIKTLKVLDLSNTRIFYLPNNTFSGVPSLEKLVLSENGLRSLDFNFLDTYLPKLTYLDLSSNPWRCDCRLAKLRNWWVERNMKPRNQFVVCDKPESLNGHTWDAINDCTDMPPYTPQQNNLNKNNDAKKSNQNKEGNNGTNINNLAPLPPSLNGLLTPNSKEKENRNSVVSERILESESKQSSLSSEVRGVLLGFSGMLLAIGLGLALYYFVVNKSYRTLPANNDASELDL